MSDVLDNDLVCEPEGPKGVGGWLIFPAILWPLSCLVGLGLGVAEGIAAGGSEDAISVGILVLLAAPWVWLLYLAFAHRPAWTWAWPVLMVGVSVILTLWMPGEMSGTHWPWLAVWLLYIHKSKRVRATFGRNFCG